MQNLCTPETEQGRRTNAKLAVQTPLGFHFGGAGKVVSGSGSFPSQRRHPGHRVPTASPAALNSVPLRVTRDVFAPTAARSPRSSPGSRRRLSASFTSAPASFVHPQSAGSPSSSASRGSASSSSNSAGSPSPLPSPCQGFFPGRQRAPAPSKEPRPCPGISIFIVPGQFHFVIR